MKENCNQILRVTRRVINNIAGDAEIERQQGNFGMFFRSDHREPSGGGGLYRTAHSFKQLSLIVLCSQYYFI